MVSFLVLSFNRESSLWKLFTWIFEMPPMDGNNNDILYKSCPQLLTSSLFMLNFYDSNHNFHTCAYLIC